MSDLSVCSCGGAPVISSVSLAVPTANWQSTRYVPSAETGTSPCSNDLNPGASNLTLYTSRIKCDTEKLPDSLVVVVTEVFLVWLVTVTFALATAAPCG